MDKQQRAVNVLGTAAGAMALTVGTVLTGVTLFLTVPLVVFAIPALYATWRVRRARLIEAEDRAAVEVEQGVAADETRPSPLVELVYDARAVHVGSLPTHESE